MKTWSQADTTNEAKIGDWSSQWKQDRKLIQPIKTRSKDDLANEDKIDDWFSQ